MAEQKGLGTNLMVQVAVAVENIDLTLAVY